MARIVVIGAGTGGVPAAYELRGKLGEKHTVTLVNASSRFPFVPSNPWVAVGWRQREDRSLELAPYLEKRGITFIAQAVKRIAAPATSWSAPCMARAASARLTSSR